MTTASLVAVGLGLLLIVAAGVVVLWIVDARRAQRVASNPERIQGGPRRWWRRGAGRR